jgi:hypothetical protein
LYLCRTDSDIISALRYVIQCTFYFAGRIGMLLEG